MKLSSAKKRFLYVLIVFHITWISWAFIIKKGAFLLWLNGLQSFNLDVFFNVFTYFGDGILIVIVSLIFLIFRKYMLALWNLITYLGSGLLVQIPKRIMDMPRPAKFFPNFQELNLPIWVDFRTHHSFPSGHTTSAFAMLVFFALVVENNYIRYILLTIAFITGISRVYLLQHFLTDVSVGAIIGSFFSVLAYYFISKKNIRLN